MAAFWIGYFLLEHFPARPVTRMPELAIDSLIPFQPAAALIYLSQFVTMPLAIWLMTSRRQLWICCRALALLIGASFAVFYLWPTSVARPELGPGSHWCYDLIAKADLPRNACPSLHAAFGVFTATCAWEVFRGWKNSRWLVGIAWVWTGAVLASTLLIKQHVFLDLLAGIVLGAAGCWLARWPEKAVGRRHARCAKLPGTSVPGGGTSVPVSMCPSELTGRNFGASGGPTGDPS